MSFPNPATIALCLTSFIVGAAGFFKAIGGQPAKELKKLGYPMLFLQALGAAEAALGVLSYFDPVTASLGIVLCMGGATQNNLILENNPGKTVFTVLIAGASAYGAGVYPLLASAAFAAGFIGNFVTIPVLKSILGEDIKRA